MSTQGQQIDLPHNAFQVKRLIVSRLIDRDNFARFRSYGGITALLCFPCTTIPKRMLKPAHLLNPM